MPDEQQGKASQEQPKGGSIGKEVAAELSGKISNDDQHKLDHESDANYDAQFQQHLVTKLKPEVEAFNDKAEFADAILMKSETDMLRFYRDNVPAFAIVIKHRTLHFLDPHSTEPVATLAITGGPDEYFLHGGSGNAAPMDETAAIKGLLRLAVGGKFQAD